MNESANRAFMYGESVFTTMKMVDGQVQNWDYHFDRMRKGIEFVYGPFLDEENWKALLKDRLEARYQMESGDKIIRLTVYRDQERGLQSRGLISVMDLKINLLASALEHKAHVGSYKLRTCEALTRPEWWPSYLKAGSYLETILLQRRVLKPGDDDVLFLSRNDTVLESSIANIFILRHNTLYTAPAGPNVLEGVMRKRVMEVARDYFDDCLESETGMDQLFKADGIFGSNSIKGLFLVDQVDDYKIKYTQEVLNKFEVLRSRVSP